MEQKRYLVTYQKSRRGMLPTTHNCLEYAKNKTEIRKYWSGSKILKIEELED